MLPTSTDNENTQGFYSYLRHISATPLPGSLAPPLGQLVPIPVILGHTQPPRTASPATTASATDGTRTPTPTSAASSAAATAATSQSAQLSATASIPSYRKVSKMSDHGGLHFELRLPSTLSPDGTQQLNTEPVKVISYNTRAPFALKINHRQGEGVTVKWDGPVKFVRYNKKWERIDLTNINPQIPREHYYNYILETLLPPVYLNRDTRCQLQPYLDKFIDRLIQLQSQKQSQHLTNVQQSFSVLYRVAVDIKLKRYKPPYTYEPQGTQWQPLLRETPDFSSLTLEHHRAYQERMSHFFQSKHQKGADVLMLQEAGGGLNMQHSDHTYHLAFEAAAQNYFIPANGGYSNHGRTRILLRNELDCESAPPARLPLDPDLRAAAIKLSKRGERDGVTLVNVHISPGKAQEQHVLEAIKDLEDSGDRIVIAGDFNAELHKNGHRAQSVDLTQRIQDTFPDRVTFRGTRAFDEAGAPGSSDMVIFSEGMHSGSITVTKNTRRKSHSNCSSARVASQSMGIRRPTLTLSTPTRRPREGDSSDRQLPPAKRPRN